MEDIGMKIIFEFVNRNKKKQRKICRDNFSFFLRTRSPSK